MAYGDLKVRNLIWNTGSGDNTVVLSALLTSSSPSWTGTATGVNLTLSGDLQVNGTTTTINTQTLDVEDHNITLGKVTTPSDTTANNGGITLKGASDKTFNWVNATDAWTSSEHIALAAGKNLITAGDFHITGDSTNSIQLRVVPNEKNLVAVANGAVELYYDNAKKFETTSSGIATSGSLAFTSASNGISLLDNGKVKFGGGDDLQIYHNGSHSFIHDGGTGDLRITGSTIKLLDSTQSENLLVATENGSVELYWDNTKYFETLNGGARVNGVLHVTSHLDMGDGDTIKLGDDDDLQIYHNGTHSYIKDVGTGALKICSNALSFRNAADNEDVAYFLENGRTELYYDNVKKFETTSGGINVTGAISVNGAALSAAPQITGTASGAIAAHKPVIVHTDGTLKEVTQTVTARSSASIGAENAFKTQTLGSMHAAYDSQSQTTVVLYRNLHFGQNPGIARIQAISHAANGTATNGAQLDISWGANAYAYDLKYDPTSECMLALFNYNNESFFCSFTISGTTGTTESHDQIKAGATSSATLCPCPAAGKLFVFNAVGNRTEGWAYTNVGTGTSLGSWTHGNGVYLNGSSTGSESFLNSVYHSDSGKVVIIYRDNNDSDRLKSRVVSYDSSNNRLTFANSNDVTTAAVEDLALEYDPNANKLIALFRDSSNHCCFKIGTLSGTSISWGTKRTLQQNARYPKAKYTSIGNQIFISYADSSNRWSYKYGVISGTDITIGNSASGYLDSSVNAHDQRGGVVFDTKISEIVASTVQYHNGNYGATRTAEISTAVSNLTTGFAGFSDAAYSNGATATINVTGNTTTQSGLTAGTNYFVQNDGSLGTMAGSAATVEAGLALSSTKLLIKG